MESVLASCEGMAGGLDWSALPCHVVLDHWNIGQFHWNKMRSPNVGRLCSTSDLDLGRCVASARSGRLKLDLIGGHDLTSGKVLLHLLDDSGAGNCRTQCHPGLDPAGGGTSTVSIVLTNRNTKACRSLSLSRCGALPWEKSSQLLQSRTNSHQLPPICHPSVSAVVSFGARSRGQKEWH